MAILTVSPKTYQPTKIERGKIESGLKKQIYGSADTSSGEASLPDYTYTYEEPKLPEVKDIPGGKKVDGVYLWRNGAGELIPVHQMDDYYINNCLNVLDRKKSNRTSTWRPIFAKELRDRAFHKQVAHSGDLEGMWLDEPVKQLQGKAPEPESEPTHKNGSIIQSALSSLGRSQSIILGAHQWIDD